MEKPNITDIEANLIDADDRAEYEDWLDSLDADSRWRLREPEIQSYPLDKGIDIWYNTVLETNTF